jgi:hypothetical protein
VVLLQADDLGGVVALPEALHEKSAATDGGDARYVVPGGGGPDEGGVPAGA